MTNKFKYLFWGISIVEILSRLDFLPFQFLNNITKPLLMPTLAMVLYFGTKNIPNIKINIMFFALFFAWLGDIFLMFVKVNSSFFLLGLGSFLVMQITYSYIFKPFTINNLTQKPIYSLGIILFGTIILYLLFPTLGAMKIPVIFYFTAIVLMVFTTLSHWDRLGTMAAKTVFLGAILFMISDSLIAINKFYFAFKLSGFLIMTTYILGQWYIVEGYSKLMNDKKN